MRRKRLHVRNTFRDVTTAQGYSIIYADPPWQHNDPSTSGQRGAGFKYSLMSTEDIARLPVWRLAAHDCLLALWWVGPMPQEALYVVDAWGFTLKTMKGFSWRKLTVHGKEHFGGGNYTRCNTEDCLFAVRGKPKRLCASVRQVINAKRREHSRKPDEAATRLVQLYGDVPRIELFARGARQGWTVWGDQSETSYTT